MRRCNVSVKIAGAAAVMLALIAPESFCSGDLSNKGYHAVVLERRDAMRGRSIDALVLTAAGSRVRFIRRLDEDYRLVLNATNGTPVPEVTADNSLKYEMIIKQNHLVPRAIRDNSGREAGVVYCGLNPCYINCEARKDGTILLDVKGNVFSDNEIPGILERASTKE
ncbi:MAG: hypothetical protein WCY10_03110 [Candidatus Omnitrophota bacterium]